MADTIFELYHRRAAPYDIVHAVQATGKNLDQLAAITQGAVHGFYTQTPTGVPGIVMNEVNYKVTFLGPGKTGAHDAVIGDYVVSDMAGGHIAVDKEMFETHYTKE